MKRKEDGSQDSVAWLRLDDLKEGPAGRGFVERLDGVHEANRLFRCVFVFLCLYVCMFVCVRGGVLLVALAVRAFVVVPFVLETGVTNHQVCTACLRACVYCLLRSLP